MIQLHLNNFEVSPNQLFTISESKGRLTVLIDGLDKDLHYTLLMRDPDSPNPDYLHFLKSNIDARDLTFYTLKGGIVDYMPPAPPTDVHRYIIELYKQRSYILYPEVMGRTNFNIIHFMKKWDLIFIDSITFRVDSRLSNNKNERQNPSRKQKEWHPEISDNEYCRCLIDIAKKNSSECNKNKNYGYDKCYSPRAICNRIPHESTKCSNKYHYDKMDDDELRALAELEGIDVPVPFSRRQLLRKMK